jgi:GNAT superfamily N-acetyltransferase
MPIRPARKNDAPPLTALSFESKGYWGYPKEYFEIWKNELTITPEYIQKSDVFVWEEESKILAYYSIVKLTNDVELAGIIIEKGYWLEHMFIHPVYLGRGIGTSLFDHLRKRCEMKGIAGLKILADPHSIGFYKKMGCKYQREYPSSIPGRTTPLLSLDLSPLRMYSKK